MSKPAALLLVLLAFAAGAAAYFLRSPTDAPRAGGPPAEQAAAGQGAQGAASSEDRAANALAPDPTALEQDSAARTPDPAAASRSPAAGRVRVSGTITVHAGGGEARAREDGTLTIALLTPSAHETRSVPVVAGAFELEAEVGAHLRVDGIVLGGRRALLEQEAAERPIPESRILALKARWSSGSIVRVLAGDTRRELDGVELVRDRAPGMPSAPQPGADVDVVLAAARSPLEVGPRPGADAAGRDVVFARAPGYAWGRVEIDHGSDLERVVELEPGGGLELSVVGHDPARASVVRLRRGAETGSTPIVERALPPAGAVVLESLPAGPLSASVEVGDWWSPALVLGSTEVVVARGGRVSARIELQRAPAAARVDLAGTLHVPHEWSAGVPVLLAVKLDPSTSGSPHAGAPVDLTPTSSAERWLWTTAGVEPGAYEMRLAVPPFTVSVEVGPEGRRDVAIEVPRPARIHVTCVDDVSGQPAPLEELFWYADRPAGVQGGALSVASETGPGVFEIVAPRGRVYLVPGGDRYAGAETVLEARDAEQAVTLRLKPATEVVLRLRGEHGLVAWDAAWAETITPVDGDGVGWAFATNARGRVLRFTKGGRYRFQIDALPGYAPVPEFELDVREGSTREHTLELVRRP